MAMSSLGAIVAVAARTKTASDVPALIIVKVFEFDGTDWNQKGNDIFLQLEHRLIFEIRLEPLVMYKCSNLTMETGSR